MQEDEKIKHEDNHSPVVREAFFRFYEELNEHLELSKQKRAFVYKFKGKPSVKNVIESVGVPHTEVDLILVNGNSVNFSYLMKGNEYVSVYPVFESLDISPVLRLRPEPLRKIKFIVDVNLGKLAPKLRLLGFDTLFRNDFDDNEIIETAAAEKRIILTRDKGIFTHNKVTHGYWLRNDNPSKQLKEVVSRLQLINNFKPFTRCSVCNGRLIKVDKSSIVNRIFPDTIKYYEEFWECANCNKNYWKGSHYQEITRLIKTLKEENDKNN